MRRLVRWLQVSVIDFDGQWYKRNPGDWDFLERKRALSLAAVGLVADVRDDEIRKVTG